jgi:hypothetical protein
VEAARRPDKQDQKITGLGHGFNPAGGRRGEKQVLQFLVAIFIALPVRSLDQLSLANRLKEIGRMEGSSHREKARS